MSRSNPMPPTINIAGLLRAPDSATTEAAEAIHAACLDTGFFIVTGHGLDAEIDSLFDAARAFFALAPEVRERTPRNGRYGYIPHRRTAIDQSRASDNTEYLDIGLGDEIELPAVEGFTPAVRTYQAAAVTVAATLLRTLSVGLGTDPDYFADRMVHPQCRLRLLHYPEVEPGPDGRLPVPNAPHTDYGLITLLATDGVPGLEVKPIDLDWTPVVAPRGSLVINLGDMLARWTNDRYRSTPHRVVGPARGDRISIPFFINPDPSTMVDCIPSCLGTGERPRYQPVTAGDFLASRIDGTTEPYVNPTDGPIRRVSR